MRDCERLALETGPDTRAVASTFHGAPLCSNIDELEADVAFVGVPYDLGQVVPGARFAPDAVRGIPVFRYATKPSADGTTPVGYYDLDADRQLLEGVTMADCGNVVVLPGDVDRNLWRVTRVVRAIVARGSLLVAFGGDQTVTAAAARGFESCAPIDIVHFDAHLDYLDHVEGVRWLSSSGLRRCAEFPWVRHITHVGWRAGDSGRQRVDDARARGNRVITADQFRQAGPERAMALVPDSDALYVSIDLDVMDPALCPGTGGQELGGFTYLEMRAALRALAGRGHIVGIDMVDVVPRLDPTGISVRTASRLVIDLLAAVFDPAVSRSAS
jgi:agmatinase